MNCSQCGAEIHPTERFCSDCGHAVAAAPESVVQRSMETTHAHAEILCTYCGTPVESDEKFCGSCGQPVVQKAVTSKNQSCPSCGTVLGDPGALFCGKCGSPLTSAGRPQLNKLAQVPEGIRSSPPGAVVSARSPVLSSSLIVALVGFLIAGVALFLPWDTSSIPGYSSTSNAWEDHASEATVLLVLAAIGLLTLITLMLHEGVRQISWTKFLPVVIGSLIVAFGVIAYLTLNAGTFATSSGTLSTSIGIGPYLVIVGGVVAAIGSVLGLVGQNDIAGRS